MQKQHAAIMTANTSGSNAFFMSHCLCVCIQTSRSLKCKNQMQTVKMPQIRRFLHAKKHADTHLLIQWRERERTTEKPNEM